MLQPLYIKRNVLNSIDIINWAKANGMKKMLHLDELHVTVAFIRTPVDHSLITLNDDQVMHFNSNMEENYKLKRLGSSLSIAFSSSNLVDRTIDIYNKLKVELPPHKIIPHVALTYKNVPFDWEEFGPYTGNILLGPELIVPLNLNYNAQEIDI
jgi:uncharacterized protein